MDISSNNMILTGNEDGAVRLYDTRGGKLVNTYNSHNRGITSI